MSSRWVRRKQVELSRGDVVQLAAIAHDHQFSSVARVVIPSRYHTSCRTLSSNNFSWINSVTVTNNYTPILIRSVAEDDYRYRVVCASGSSGPSLLLFDIETGKQLLCLDGHTSAIFSVQISQPLIESRTLPVLISGSQDGIMKVWDLQTGRVIHSIGDGIHSGPVKVVFVYEGLNPQLYSVTHKTIWVWLLESGELIRSIEASHSILSLNVYRAHEAFQDELNPAVLFAGTSQGKILSWHLDSGDSSFQYIGHHGPVHTLTSVTNKHLKMMISGGFDGFVKLWNLVTGEILYSIHDPHHSCPVLTLNLLHTPQVGLVVGYSDSTISVIDISNGMKLFELLGHTDAVKSVACTTNPRPFIISGSNDATVKIWDLSTAAKEEYVEMKTRFIHEGLYQSLQWRDKEAELTQTQVETDSDDDDDENDDRDGDKRNEDVKMKTKEKEKERTNRRRTMKKEKEKEKEKERV